MARLSEADVIRIKKFMAQTLRDNPKAVAGRENKTSPTKFTRCIKKELGIEVSRQTVNRYLKENLDAYLEANNFSDHEGIREYEALMSSAKSIWDNPNEPATARTKAYNSYLRAKKQKENLLKDLMSHEVKKAEAERPVHLIKIEPRSALHKCPKCGEEFYDIKKTKGSKTNTQDEDASE